MGTNVFAQVAIDTAWNGSPAVLSQYQGVTMPQTPNGSLVIGYLNRATQNNAGRLSFSSGGRSPQIVPVPALMRMIGILVNNWGVSNLNITNLSAAADTPIFVEAFGPGIAGAQPMQLNPGTRVQLAVAQAAQGTTLPQWMQIILTSNTANLTTVAIVGGPADGAGNNAYVIALNSPSGNTGPGGNPAPPGYYATAADNSYALQFNWSSSVVYVANLSSQTASPVTVLLQPV